jgi:SM-20-related protein
MKNFRTRPARRTPPEYPDGDVALLAGSMPAPPDVGLWTPHFFAQLGETGLAVVDNALGSPVASAIRGAAEKSREQGELSLAGIGRRRERRVDPDIRSDLTRWVDPETAPAELAPFFALLEDLRLALNRTVFLGLQSAEVQLAYYPPGSRYDRHLDAFRDNPRRAITVVYYLNQGWSEGDGGALRAWLPSGETVDIAPLLDRLVVFMSQEIEHAVLPVAHSRFALSGWLGARATHGLPPS